MTTTGDDFDPFVPSATRSVSMVQAGQMLGISRRTLYYWIRNGRVRTLRTPMGSQRILMESIRSHWLERF